MNTDLDYIFNVMTQKIKEADQNNNPQKMRDAFMFVSGVFLVMRHTYGEDKDMEELLESLKKAIFKKFEAEILEL